MGIVGKIAGVDCAFGARWDDVKDGAKFKAVVSKTKGFYDGKEVNAKLYPAPAVVSKFFTPNDLMAAYAVFYHDDEGLVFASIVYSAGQIAPLSETIYDTSTEWEAAILRSTRDPNVDQVYVPAGSVSYSDDKHIIYDIPAEVDLAGIEKLSSASAVKNILAITALAVVMAAIPVGAWIFIANPFEEKVEEAVFVVERIKPNMDKVLESCAVDLKTPWPAPPEWTLEQEGCIAAPDVAQVAFPKPVDQRPYAYRYYTLNPQVWDEYLSRASFVKMAERFPGSVIEGENQFILYMPYDLERDTLPANYIPNTNPVEVIRETFVGSMDIQGGGGGVSGTSGFTDLELDIVLDRLNGKKVLPVHMFRNMSNKQTGVEFAPERIETREVRVN